VTPTGAWRMMVEDFSAAAAIAARPVFLPVRKH
jgi:hypothetical protein